MARLARLLCVSASILWTVLWLTVLSHSADAQITGTTSGIAPFGTVIDHFSGQPSNHFELTLQTVIAIRTKYQFFAQLGIK